jgi:DNA repair protein RadC
MALRGRQIRCSLDAAAFIKPIVADYRHEVFGVLYLNARGRLNNWDIVGQGGLTATIADTRVIFKKALENNAVGIIVFHNHPSGESDPSEEDKALTERLHASGQLISIKLQDRIIIGQTYFSFEDEGLIPKGNFMKNN